MAEMKHIVETNRGVAIHREVPVARSSEAFDTSQISSATRTSFKKVCVSGDAVPEDYRHVFYAVLGKDVVDTIINI